MTRYLHIHTLRARALLQESVMGNPRAVVVIGHGFVSEPKDSSDTSTLSAADRDRVAEAIRITEYEGAGTIFYTQDVPYTPKLPHMTVAWCNSLVARNVLSPFMRHKLVPGKNPYEQSWNTCYIAGLRGITCLKVIASYGYFEAFGRMWTRAGERNNLTVRLVAAPTRRGQSHGPIIDTHDINAWDLALADMAATGGKFGHKVASLLANLAIRDAVRV
jgi:hypothetical protein